ncbi:MAG: putative membrane protein YfcA [Sphingobacteriales bacterium]|jgi:uncharacterized membrane protein YfcA
MSVSTCLILVCIGLFAGILSGFVGIGGGIVIVPCLIYFLGLGQHEAQGTSLALMLPPIGILAFMNYYKAGNLNLNYALVVAATFIIGGYFGSKISLKMDPAVVKKVFGIVMLVASVKIIFSK